MKKLTVVLGATAICAAGMAQAEMPVFSAECLSNVIESDASGTVRFNGAAADVQEFNENYYEATIESLTVSISHDGGGENLIVSYTGSGGTNGVCSVTSVQASAPAADTTREISSSVTQEAIDACIDAVRAETGGAGGTVLSGEFSEANTVIMMRDSGGSTWRCLTSSDGSYADLEMADAGAAPASEAMADDGGGAMAGAAGPDFWEVDVSSALKVHSEPSTGSPSFFDLPGGAVVRNLGCRWNEGRNWCQVPTGPNDGASIGWVAGEFLTEATGPARMPESAPTRVRTPRPHSQAHADTLSGGPDFWEVNVHSRLNVHQAPSVTAPTVARLPRGAVVANRGCRFSEGRTWCEIADGDASGWAAAEYLVESAGPVRVVRRVDRPARAVPRTLRLRLAGGMYGGWHDDMLPPGGAVRYVLGADARQTMEVSFHDHDRHLEYRIFAPDGTVLLDRTPTSVPYQDEIPMSGDYVVEVINLSRHDARFDMHLGFH